MGSWSILCLYIFFVVVSPKDSVKGDNAKIAQRTTTKKCPSAAAKGSASYLFLHLCGWEHKERKYPEISQTQELGRLSSVAPPTPGRIRSLDTPPF